MKKTTKESYVVEFIIGYFLHFLILFPLLSKVIFR